MPEWIAKRYTVLFNTGPLDHVAGSMLAVPPEVVREGGRHV